MTARPHRVLLMACGKRKRAEPCAAIDLYTGPAFRIVALARQAHVVPFTVVILSARYGLIDEQRITAPYEQKMTKARSVQLQPLLRHQWTLIVQPLLQDSTATFMHMGNRYRETLEALGLVQDLPGLTIAKGGMGQQLSALQAWLKSDGRGK